MDRILSPVEWDHLVAAEAPISTMGLCGITDVLDRSESAPLAWMFDSAMAGVEMCDDEWPTQWARHAEVARRIAFAQHYLITGDLPAVAAS